MLREHCTIGMKVVFGRPNGEKTVGEVAEIHQTTADIRTLEARGDGNRGSEEHRTKKQPAGTVWKPGFDIMEPLDERLLEALRTLPPKDENLLDYLKKGSETLIGKSIRWLRRNEATSLLEAIFFFYRNRRDISKSYWKYRRMQDPSAAYEADALLSDWKDYNRRLSLLFQALGRPVSEAVSQAWEDDRRIHSEIDKEFGEATDRIKARRHWQEILERFPNDCDHQERIHLWDERKESQAWIEEGLNEARQTPPTPPPAKWQTPPTPPPVKWPTPRPFKFPTLEQRRKVWQAQKEAARQAQQAVNTP